MHRVTYHIEKMDCAAEEQLIRLRLEGMDGVERLVFDLTARRLTVYLTHDAEAIGAALDTLNLGTRPLGHAEPVSEVPAPTALPEERRPLILALLINAAFFIGELTAGFLSGSMGLVADSLDMLADALVYALSLAAVGGTDRRKKRLARSSGYLQFGLAVLGLVEVMRRVAMGEGVPDVLTMAIVAALALLGNLATLYLLSRTRRGEAHVEASWIFTSNDIKVNALVILSAGFVWLTASRLPDLLVGALIFVIVANGARQILKLST